MIGSLMSDAIWNTVNGEQSRLWHLTDLTNISYQEQSGRDADITGCPLVTDAVEEVFLGVRTNFYRGTGEAVRK